MSVKSYEVCVNNPPPDLLTGVPVIAKAKNGHAALFYDSSILPSTVNVAVDAARNAHVVITVKTEGNLCNLNLFLQKTEALVLLSALVSAIKSHEVTP